MNNNNNRLDIEFFKVIKNKVLVHYIFVEVGRLPLPVKKERASQADLELRRDGFLAWDSSLDEHDDQSDIALGKKEKTTRRKKYYQINSGYWLFKNEYFHLAKDILQTGSHYVNVVSSDMNIVARRCHDPKLFNFFYSHLRQHFHGSELISQAMIGGNQHAFDVFLRQETPMRLLQGHTFVKTLSLEHPDRLSFAKQLYQVNATEKYPNGSIDNVKHRMSDASELVAAFGDDLAAIKQYVSVPHNFNTFDTTVPRLASHIASLIGNSPSTLAPTLPTIYLEVMVYIANRHTKSKYTLQEEIKKTRDVLSKVLEQSSGQTLDCLVQSHEQMNVFVFLNTNIYKKSNIDYDMTIKHIIHHYQQSDWAVRFVMSVGILPIGDEAAKLADAIADYGGTFQQFMAVEEEYGREVLNQLYLYPRFSKELAKHLWQKAPPNKIGEGTKRAFLMGAAKSGHVDMIDWMMAEGPKDKWREYVDPMVLVIESLSSKNVEMMQHLLQIAMYEAAQKSISYLSSALYQTDKHRITVVENWFNLSHAIPMGRLSGLAREHLMVTACYHGYPDTLENMVLTIPDDIPIYPNFVTSLIKNAINAQNVEAFRFIIESPRCKKNPIILANENLVAIGQSGSIETFVGISKIVEMNDQYLADIYMSSLTHGNVRLAKYIEQDILPIIETSLSFGTIRTTSFLLCTINGNVDTLNHILQTSSVNHISGQFELAIINSLVNFHLDVFKALVEYVVNHHTNVHNTTNCTCSLMKHGALNSFVKSKMKETNNYHRITDYTILQYLLDKSLITQHHFNHFTSSRESVHLPSWE
ncbi:hypothetical protein DFA_08499 [Cavenderia fasciculata]|uniref:Uncharacterized protein n=1 Tax=Cavenderia fasciculata TaxID=261658 RepID=F4Q2N6_CACFS|nr:uncharacterized protein DFA_08499 [Cavenderia fasciculata]EGG17503.1 hypothetical protein DFA_08499 [Cavenderia fasciculata]|eukprot:XP_004355987.1 hypothetical protein DFA_08499 [Cavenderia fasciculata]